MRITTWNVNGLRAVLQKDALDWAFEQPPDMLCLQEIKSRPDQLQAKALERFATYNSALWNPAEKPGYSGVATFSKTAPEVSGFGLDSPDFDREGRVVWTQQAGFRLFNIYFPNGQRDHNRLQYKLDFYARLLKLCDTLHAAGELIVLCGDFNTAHREIDLRNPHQNANTSGFLPEERAWIDRYLEHGFVDAYRAFYPERVQYTWWTYISNARARDVGWRLDYFLISKELMPRVRDVIIHNELFGSDHCPVSLLLDQDET
jgi:exodeoxyribonuclease III